MVDSLHGRNYAVCSTEKWMSILTQNWTQCSCDESILPVVYFGLVLCFYTWKEHEKLDHSFQDEKQWMLQWINRDYFSVDLSRLRVFHWCFIQFYAIIFRCLDNCHWLLCLFTVPFNADHRFIGDLSHHIVESFNVTFIASFKSWKFELFC